MKYENGEERPRRERESPRLRLRLHDDNSTAAQVHRFFAKVEGLGIDLGEDMFSDPWA